MDAAILQQLQTGLEAHRKGDLTNAERLYRAVLVGAPDALDAYNLLGRLLVQSGRAGEAPPLLRHAIDRAPGQVGLWLSYTEALLASGDLDTAQSAAETAHRLAPDDIDALFAWAEISRLRADWAVAADGYRKLLRQKPDHAGAWLNLATALQAMGDLPGARQAAEKALEHAPGAPECHNNLGSILAATEQHEAALRCFERALELRPDYPPALINRGATLRDTGRAAEALPLLEQAVRVSQGHPDALSGFAQAKHALGDLDDALLAYRAALARRPDDAETQWNFALAALAKGEFAHGWLAYRWRWRKALPPLPRRSWPWPLWQGDLTEAAGKHLLLWGEQGLGDRLLFLQFLPALLDAGTRVTLETDPRLIPLLQRRFPQIAYIAEDTNADPEVLTRSFDGHLPLGNLPVDAPPGQAILQTDTGRAVTLADRYRAGSGDRLIGLSWRSANPRLGDAKSLTTGDLAPLADLRQTRFVCLQYDVTAAEHATLHNLFGERYVHDPAIDARTDLTGLVDQIAALDATLTVSNLTAHLAGAAGRPVHVLAPAGKSLFFYLMAGGDHTPWYPTMRISRPGPGQGLETALGAAIRGLESLAK
jgi:tetratricopeptide (TPR) repeat protein